ncbi:glycosyltransferase family 4 protein [Candidatus Woesearchaeota archaeon]|nr:glycosyltransferase family 4 protein [Candidatus Woesearchaeota archaeon]
MKVLKLGWEFPPFFAGGVGMVCAALSDALVNHGIDLTYVMPSGPEDLYQDLNQKRSPCGKGKFKIIITNNRYKNVRLKTAKINSLLTAYTDTLSYKKEYESYIERGKNLTKNKPIYGKDLKQEIYRFAEQVKLLVEDEEFDVIHSHDWVTNIAGIALKEKTGKPLIAHVHITEFDKTGQTCADPEVYEIERRGMHESDLIIVVSNKIKQTCMERYGVPEHKIRVIHNAATPMNDNVFYDNKHIKATDKVVLFAGRVTLQKGPDYFVDAAKLVLEKQPNTMFIVAGSGDMLPQIIEKVARIGLSEKFIFTGFYTREQAEKLFSMADVFVMPSVSEPFGVVPFEAQIKKTPTIISKQSGIAEVLYHTLKVDFWDVRELANKILALLKYTTLNKELSEKGYWEAKLSTWDKPATRCIEVYNEAINMKK